MNKYKKLFIFCVFILITVFYIWAAIGEGDIDENAYVFVTTFIMFIGSFIGMAYSNYKLEFPNKKKKKDND